MAPLNRPLGLIGGLSWRSTAAYYTHLNRTINAAHGNNTNPPLWIASLNQQEIHQLQGRGDWDGIGARLEQAALGLEAAGVAGIALASLTAHRCAERLRGALRVPLLAVADALRPAIRQRGWTRVGLLGTRHTMEQPFLIEPLTAGSGLEVLVPPPAQQRQLQELILSQLSLGRFEEAGAAVVRRAITALAEQGAEAVILGCTELPLLPGLELAERPLLDALTCHADALAAFIQGAPDSPWESAPPGPGS